jgi:alcohol dehydrogenase (cytochrome c)/quinohemoprotein ethanol dehydrogenase
VKRKAAWRSREGSARGGTMTTASNLVFQANGNNLIAFRADTGEKVGSIAVGSNWAAGPITYAIDGVQYIAGASGISAGRGSVGGLLVALKLGGTGALPPPPPAPPAPVLNPPENFGTEASLALGKEKYEQNCSICHEAGQRMGGFPELRTSPYINSEAAFKVVVLDGALTEAGMLSFS